jgi:hypothetical protein
MKPNTIIYNFTNWDGKFCLEIALQALGKENCTYLGWAPGAPALHFPDEGNVIVLGLPLDSIFGSAEPYDCENNWSRLTWIHNDPDAIRNTDEGVPGLRLAGVANCRLAYQWFVRAPRAITEGLDPCAPSRADFLKERVVEPRCLLLVQQLMILIVPSLMAKDFFWGLEHEEELEWDRVIEFTSGIFGDSYVGRLIHMGQVARESLDCMNASQNVPGPYSSLIQQATTADNSKPPVVQGHWRSAQGENHGLHSKPGDQWVEWRFNSVDRQSEERVDVRKASNYWAARLPGGTTEGYGDTPRLACVNLGRQLSLTVEHFRSTTCEASTADLDQRDRLQVVTLEDVKTLLGFSA